MYCCSASVNMQCCIASTSLIHISTRKWLTFGVQYLGLSKIMFSLHVVKLLRITCDDLKPGLYML
jgi:hypothetical protein